MLLVFIIPTDAAELNTVKYILSGNHDRNWHCQYKYESEVMITVETKSQTHKTQAAACPFTLHSKLSGNVSQGFSWCLACKHWKAATHKTRGRKSKVRSEFKRFQWRRWSASCQRWWSWTAQGWAAPQYHLHPEKTIAHSLHFCLVFPISGKKKFIKLKCHRNHDVHLTGLGRHNFDAQRFLKN